MRYLRFISGPRMGTRVTVRLPADAGSASGGAGQTVVLGRDRTAGCPIDDLGISRHHAELFLQEGRTVLRDLESTNGTFVNGELITEKVLVNGDQISVGDAVMIFEESASRRRTTGLRSRPGRPGTQSVTFEDRAEEEGSAHIRLDPKVSGYFDPAAIRTRPEAAERLAKLYRFISEVAPVVSPDRLAEEVLDRAFDAIGADRGFIMLLDEAGDLRPEHMRVRDPSRSADTIKLSRRMTQRVLESGQSILSSDTLHDRRFKDSAAFSLERVNSFVCAPLKHRDKMIGLLYVDTVGMTRPLSENDLELVTAMASLAGTQFANARYYAAVVDSAEYTQSILRCLRSGLVVTDPDLKIRQVNEAAIELLGRREQELVGRSFTEFRTLEPLWCIMQDTVRSDIPSERREVVIEVGGDTVPVGVSTSLLKDHENRVCGVVASFRSLKVINKLSKQLRMAQHLAALGEMAAGVAHEIRNPLNSIRGFAQLTGEMLPEAASWSEPGKLESTKGYLGIVIEEVDRMNRLVQDLLDFSRQRELAMAQTDIVELVDGTLRESAQELEGAAVEVVRKMPEGPVSVLGNAAKLKQVLVNVIRNAIQAMTVTAAPGAPAASARRLEVAVSSTGEAGPVEIAFGDSGTGMDEETKARLFEPFFTTREQGTGLGLAICRKIVEKHGGTMEADSRLGAGTTMRILLPRR